MPRQKISKPRPETMDRFLRARNELIAESKKRDPKATNHNPSVGEIGERLGVSRERAGVLLAAANLPTYKTSIVPVRADLSKPISRKLKGIARTVVENLRRLYTAELGKPEPRSDAELASAAGYTGRPDKNAAAFRFWIVGGSRAPSLVMLERLAAAFGVEVEELVRKS